MAPRCAEGLELWLVVARPEGRQCLVISSSGSTSSRTRSGDFLHRNFQSALPEGSRGTRGGGGYCVLDCIFHEPDSTYYVLDAMCWKGYLLYDCTAEFRSYWLHSKLAEMEAPLRRIAAGSNDFRFVALNKLKVGEDAYGINASYAGAHEYARDGILLYNSEAQYELGAPTPLMLQWKVRN